MKTIFFKRQVIDSETLLISALSENGSLQTLKFPKVLRSKKRNSFFLVPGSMWDCVYRESEKIVVPSEYTLHSSPIDSNPDYHDLSILAEFIKPLDKLWKTGTYTHYFNWYLPLLSGWSHFSNNDKKVLVVAAMLHYCQQEGLFPNSYDCAKCTREDVYLHADIGIICEECNPNHLQLDALPVTMLKDIGQLNHASWPKISPRSFSQLKRTLSGIMDDFSK